MWQGCKANKVAAITYTGIQNVDLRPYSRVYHPPRWKEVENKGSLNHFVWDIRGGDTIYVGDSESHRVVGMGYAVADIGELAYRFDPDSPISTERERWCHLIDVDWDETFVPFLYKDRAPLSTVLELKREEIESYAQESRASASTTGQSPTALLAEASYPRYSPAALRLICRRHAVLSNEFKLWIERVFRILVSQEQNQIDATFETESKRFLVEFKIPSHGDTKRAIREALGQILEYNLYPPRIRHDHWLLILDEAPSADDLTFVSALSARFTLPLHLGWRQGSGFEFGTPLPIRRKS